MKFFKLILFSLIFLWSCASTQVSMESLLGYCDKAFLCISTRIDEYASAAFKDPEIIKTSAKLVNFVCDTSKNVNFSLVVDIQMQFKKYADPDPEKACIVARVNIGSVLHYVEKTDVCEIGVVTSNFEVLKYCSQDLKKV